MGGGGGHLGRVTAAQQEEGAKVSLHVRRETSHFPVAADHIAEMVRQAVYEQYPAEAYSKGFRVYTTLRAADQEAAYTALRRGVLEYDRRHGYRGPEGFAKLTEPLDEDEIDDALAEHPDSEDLVAALVLSAGPGSVEVALRNGTRVKIEGEALKFVARALDELAHREREAREQRERDGDEADVD